MHLDVTTPQRPVLHLHKSASKGPELHLDLPRLFWMTSWTWHNRGLNCTLKTRVFAATGRVYTKGAWAALGYTRVDYRSLFSPGLLYTADLCWPLRAYTTEAWAAPECVWTLSLCWSVLYPLSLEKALSRLPKEPTGHEIQFTGYNTGREAMVAGQVSFWISLHMHC